MATLVLLHELGGGDHSWDLVLPHLPCLRCGTRIVTPTLWGARHGAEASVPFSMQDEAQDVLRLLDEMAVQADVWIAAIAASAPVALEMVASRKDLFAGLILCSPALQVDPARQSYLAGRSALALREGMAAIAWQVLERSYPEALRGDTARFHRYRDRFIGNDPHAYARANQALIDFEIAPRHFALDCPVLLLAGTMDVLRPVEQVEALAVAFPRATTRVLESAHLMPVQTPELVAAEINAFMAQHAGA